MSATALDSSTIRAQRMEQSSKSSVKRWILAEALSASAPLHSSSTMATGSDAAAGAEDDLLGAAWKERPSGREDSRGGG